MAGAPGPSRGGIRIRLVALVLICLVPLVLVLIWNASRQRDQSRRDAVDDTLRLSRLSAQQESAAVANARTLLGAAAAPWQADGAPATDCQALVDSVAAQSDLLSNVFAVGDDGSIGCSAEPLPGDPNLIDRAYVQAAIADRTFSAALEQPGDLVDTASFAAVLPLPAHATIALLGGTFEAGSDLDAFLASMGLPAGSEVLLIDSNGTIVAASGGVSEAGMELPAEELTAKVATDQVVEGSVDARGLDGTGRVYSFADIPQTGRSAVAVVGIPTKAAFAAGERDLRTTLIAGGIVALAAVAIALAVAELAVGRPVRSIVGTVRKIGEGDLDARTNLEGGANELVEMGRAIDVMAGDIQAREQALRVAAEERERLLGELLEAQEEERRKIAADIHDDTIQTMISAGMEVQLLRLQLDDQVPAARLRQAEQSIGTAVTRLRHLMFELEPPDAEAASMAESIEQYLESAVGEDAVAIRVDADVQVDLTGPARQVLYRNLREAVLNATRHGAARHVDVRLDPGDGGLFVAVRDDGSGMRPEDTTKRGHHGLRVMRERTEALGGWFSLDSQVGDGTSVSFWIPVES